MKHPFEENPFLWVAESLDKYRKNHSKRRFLKRLKETNKRMEWSGIQYASRLNKESVL